MPYTVTHTELPEVLILEPRVFGDDRGFFFESYNKRDFTEATGQAVEFVQDNHSRSVKGVLRGLHYQVRQPQGKLIRVTQGEVFDVAVNLMRGHPDFGRWTGTLISGQNKRQMWIPPGFAHGFVVLSDSAEFQYKTSDYYAPEYERSLLWNDPDLAIKWPIDFEPLVSAKDAGAKRLRDAEAFGEWPV